MASAAVGSGAWHIGPSPDGIASRGWTTPSMRGGGPLARAVFGAFVGNADNIAMTITKDGHENRIPVIFTHSPAVQKAKPKGLVADRRRRST
jgi:hypothetical protein